jgi:molecular chaperone Hsp33
MAEEPTGWMVRGLLAGGAVRLLFVEARALAEHTRVAHDLGPDATRLGAELVVAAALLGAHVKGEEELLVQLQGDRPPLSGYADLTAGGALRIRVSPRDLRCAEGKLSGILSVVKHVDGREVYRGVTAIAGSMSATLAAHLGDSAQVDAVLGITAAIGPDGSVERAGGWLLERLPEDDEHPSISPEGFRERYAGLAEADPGEVFDRIHGGGLDAADRVAILEQRPLVWRCRCSEEKIEGMLVALGPEELGTMADEDHGAEVTCHFCQRRYTVTELRLRQLQRSIGIA